MNVPVQSGDDFRHRNRSDKTLNRTAAHQDTIGDVLLYRKNEGDTYISVKADYPVPLFTKRLRQATMHKYTVNLLTLWWMPIDEQDLQDIPGFYRRLFQESDVQPGLGLRNGVSPKPDA